MHASTATPPSVASPGVHLAMPTAAEAKALLRAIALVLWDSTRTADIVVGEEISARAQLGYLLEHHVRICPEGRALLRDRPELGNADIRALRQLPDGTLGRELVRYLDKEGLDYHFDQTIAPYLTDPDQSYLLRRIRRNHDIWHVLLGLGPAGHEEVLLHAFTLSQLGLPSSVAIVVLGAVKHMVLEGRWRTLRRTLPATFELGRVTRPLVLVRWEELWGEPLERVRQRLGLPPVR